MSLSVIIPTLNEANHLRRCVQSAQTAGATEILVADGGSCDETVCLAEELGARVIASATGRGTQLNAGATAATGEVLLFLHADNWLPKAAGEQIAKALRDESVHHGAFRQTIDAHGFKYRWLERGNAFRARVLATPYGDQAMFARRASIETAGGFPDQPLMEDVALARKLRKLGRPVLLDGPLGVSARRWQQQGVVRQTLRNWMIVTAWGLGVSPERLVRWYRPS